jgi:soluble lytic murein transglycosylase-like protein
VASKAKGGGGGVALLFSIAIAFTFPAPHWDYHTLRFWGVSPEPPRDLIEQEVLLAADYYGLDRNLFKALVKVESGGNPRALSHAGARGLAQIIPSNAKRCGLPTPEYLWDVVNNLRCGAQILREEVDRLGNIHDALTVYNCGKVKCTEGKQYAAKVISIAKLY